MDEGRKDMTDLPEKIWVAPPHDDPLWKSGAGEWDVSEDWAVENKVAYTRTDLAEARIAELEAALRSILQIPNSDAAQGIMKAFAKDALGEET
jgi:hypothetical protein